MTQQQDIRDWYIMLHISSFAIATMMFVYTHPSEGNFASMCASIASILGLYHWFTLRDSKEPDAP